MQTPVKRCIRQKLTQEFLKADGSWTSDVSSARDFRNLMAVSKAQQEQSLQGVELVLVGDPPSENDVVVPLPPLGQPVALGRSHY
jgi:hypothetical protein